MLYKEQLSQAKVKLIIVALLFIATVCCLKLGSHIRGYSGRDIYRNLDWDMFLAWVPVGLVVVMDVLILSRKKIEAHHYLLLLPLGMIWLFFYPNAGYLITDVLHPFLQYRPMTGGNHYYDIEFWHHLLLFFIGGVIGLLLSFYSLYVLHDFVTRQFGRVLGWLFAVGVLLLSSYGIYIGRFVRWNSWDVFTRPRYLLRELLQMMTSKSQVMDIIAFSKVIFGILLLSYCILIAIATLSGGGKQPAAEPKK